MRKTLACVVVLALLLVSGAFAAEQERSRIQDRNESEVRLTGLPNAMVRVQDNETAEHLERVWERIQERRQEQFAKLSALRVSRSNETLIIEGDGEAKLFGLVPWKKHYRYGVSPDGMVVRERTRFEWAFKIPDEVN